MSDTAMHDAIDRLDSGLGEHPDVSRIIGSARRRRRRTRAVWTAGGLATAAAVAPLAVLIGGGPSTAPASPRFAAETTGDPIDAITAAVTEAFPGATVADPRVIDGPAPKGFTNARGADITGQRVVDRSVLFNVPGLARLGVTSASNGYRHADCSEAECVRVGDWYVVDIHGGPMRGVAEKDECALSLQAFPVDPARSEKVEITAVADCESAEEGAAALPSVDKLTALALDERLAPPSS